MKQPGDVPGETIDLSPEAVSSKILSAYQRIHEHLIPTGLVYDDESKLWLKCENEQSTGSFKWRGALAKLSTYGPGHNIVTASTGNHGLAVATAANLYNLDAKIFVPSTASRTKVEKIREAGADVIEIEGDSLAAELAGKKYAADYGFEWVSPYNDIDVISGQGTIGLELEEQLDTISRTYVTVGGGGLVSGIASWMKHHHPHIEIIGCQPANSPEMYLSTLAGHVVTAPDAKDTLSDGSAGPLEEDSITFPICRKLIDRFILISEEEIREAMHHLYFHMHIVAEGAACVAMAAAMKDQPGEIEGNSIVILCGGNIDPQLHQNICGY